MSTCIRTSSEVRFQNEAAVAEAVEAIVADALADKAPVEQPDVLRLTPEPPSTVPVTVVRQPVTASEAMQPEATVPPKVEKNRPSVRKFRKRRQFPRKTRRFRHQAPHRKSRPRRRNPRRMMPFPRGSSRW